jgi:hypothetical protein
MSPSGDAPRRVRFDLRRITLHGYSPRDQEQFTASLHRHLAELAADDRLTWPAAGDRFVARLEAVTIPAGASPDRAARAVATRVLEAVTGAQAGGGAIAGSGATAGVGLAAGTGGSHRG